jgi:hypothetical protein
MLKHLSSNRKAFSMKLKRYDELDVEVGLV